jgi:hypothetical protein
VTNPIREYTQHIREIAVSDYQVAGKFLAHTIINPDGFERGQLGLSDYVPSVSIDLTVIIQRGRRAGVIDIVTGPSSRRHIMTRAVATQALLLTVLDEPPTAWLPEQVREVDPAFDVQELWNRFDPSEVDAYKEAMDYTPLPH